MNTCDTCDHWARHTSLPGESLCPWNECRSGKHVATGWTTHGNERCLIHHVEGGCDCARSVVQTGPKYGCIHWKVWEHKEIDYGARLIITKNEMDSVLFDSSAEFDAICKGSRENGAV